MTQIELFDLELFEREHAAQQPWIGPAPLTFTTDYYSPAELDAAWDAWVARNGNLGSIPRSHLWRRGFGPRQPRQAPNGHELHLYGADTRCTETDHDHSAKPLPGELLTRAICPPCQWHRDGEETAIVIAWHDHAMPGWRDLPVYDKPLDRSNPRSVKTLQRWVEHHHPTEWQFPGAPIRTARTNGLNRAVPNYSPFGGYDIATSD